MTGRASDRRRAEQRARHAAQREKHRARLANDPEWLACQYLVIAQQLDLHLDMLPGTDPLYVELSVMRANLQRAANGLYEQAGLPADDPSGGVGDPFAGMPTSNP